MIHNRFTRRQFLRSSFAAIGAATVAACGASPSAAEVVIRTAGWPINPMPTSEAIAENPALSAYADALQTWMNRNPNVRIERIEANIWEPQAMLTAVASDTAPTYFLSTVIGNWSAARAQSAFSQGLMADLTDAIAETRLQKETILPAYRTAWEQTGQVDGRTFYFPIDTALEDVILYRRDLVNQAGLPEPASGWSWDDYFAIVRAVKQDGISGMGAPWMFVGEYLRTHGFDLLTQLPTPDRSWHWQQDYSDPHWVGLIDQYRKLLLEPNNAFSDAAFRTKREYRDAFHAGSLATVSSNIMGAFSAAASDTSLAALVRRLGGSYEDTVGLAPMPRGDGLVAGGVNFSGGVALPPNVTPQEAAVALDLVDYIFFGEAADAQKVATYEATGDLQAVYSNPLPLDGKYQYAGVPGSFADAWGARILREIETLVNLPQPPHRVQTAFFPPEGNVLPDSQVIEDLWSQLTYVTDIADVSAELERTASVWNQQTDSFTTSTDRATFVESANNHYAEIGRMLQEHSPDFYANRYLPFYQQKVAPVLA